MTDLATYLIVSRALLGIILLVGLFRRMRKT